jgi:hypothetical protein
MLFLFDESVIGDDVSPDRLERTVIDLEMLRTLEVVDTCWANALVMDWSATRRH